MRYYIDVWLERERCWWPAAICLGAREAGYMLTWLSRANPHGLRVRTVGEEPPPEPEE